MLNLPNTLTVIRIAMVPIVVLLMHFTSPSACLAAALVFVAASLTDLVDGYLARRMNLVTALGKFLDPLADKLLVVSALVMLVAQGVIPAWATILIIARELTVTGLRAIAAQGGTVIAADRYGKLKTVSQSIALGLLILRHPLAGFDPIIPGLVCFYAAVVLTVLSGGKYVYAYIRGQRETGL